jgi:DNA-binding GntR family transcriptional regulator
MRIDPASPEHPYRQIAAQLRQQIQRGEITGQLPSITELTAQTGWRSALCAAASTSSSRRA